MRISQIILRVSDMGRAISFWSERVGLPVLSESADFAFLDGGSIQLILNRRDGYSGTALTEVVFEMEDVRSMFVSMKERGVPFEVDLRPVTSDGSRDLLAAHFRDADGNMASLTGWADGG
jgi:methylmalonyl-CoA/ethylmalonyl-CoA epimerase